MRKPNVPVAPAQGKQEGKGPEAGRTVPDRERTGLLRRGSMVGWVSLVIVWLVWGSTYLAIRVGVESIPPLLMAAARNLMAGLIMFPLAVSPARLRGALRRRLPSSLRSSVQAAPRPFGSGVGRRRRPVGLLMRTWWAA